MATDITNAFVKQFEAEVHMEFQRMGSVVRNTVRTKNNVKGSTVTFQKAGKGAAGSKDRHGAVPIMNASRSAVEATMADRYAGEYIDKLDTLKIEHDERQVASRSIASALGRDVDDILFTAMDATTNAKSPASTFGTTPAAALAEMELMGDADVPFDHNFYFAVPWKGWGDLLDLDEFNNQDYTPGDRLWFEAVTTKFWLGFNWYPHSGLPAGGANEEKAFLYHSSAVGHGIGADFSLDVTWQGKEQAWLAVGSMSHGAIIIEDTGVREYLYNTA
jgi:hypothetical protein